MDTSVLRAKPFFDKFSWFLDVLNTGMSKGTAKASDSESDDSDLPSLIPCTDDEVDADIWIVVFFKMYICS